MSYQSVKLGEAAKFIRGITYKPSELVDNFSENSIVCMRTANVQTFLKQDDLLSVPKTLVKDTNKILIEGDILVSTANSWNLVGKCCWIPKLDYTATAGGFISILRANKSLLDQKYLYYWFNSDKIQLAARNCGRQTTNISNMDLERCLNIQIPLPPLEEQRRIAEILDKADALIQNRKKAIEKLDELLQATFIDMFGDPVTNPKGWDIKSLSEIAEYFNGLTYKPTDVSNEGTVILRSSNIQNSSLDLNDIVKVKSTIKDKLFVRENDILMCSRNGSARLVGKVALIPKLNEKMAFGAFMMIIRSHEYSQYLYSYFQTNAFRASIVSGATTTINQITNNMLNRVLLPIPDQQTLSVFSKFCINLNEQKQKMQEQLEVQETLFKSLQQQAFSGQL